MGAQEWPVVCADQVHGNRVAIVRRGDLGGLRVRPAGPCYAQTDGLLTQERRIVLNLTFADCVPVLLYCSEPLTVGVLHAGWRGTAAQIARKGVEAMCALGADAADIEAVIGPAICGKCYEVGPEVIAAMADLPGGEDLMSGEPARYVDLTELNRQALLDCRVKEEAVRKSDLCTRCGEVPMFSYRASGGGTGLHGAFVVIADD